jgi:hypothetical protein
MPELIILALTLILLLEQAPSIVNTLIFLDLKA